MRMSGTTVNAVASAVIGLVLAFAAPAQAVFFPGTRLVELMREYEKSETGGPDVRWGNVGRFEGYVMGVCDALEDTLVLPDTVTPAQITAAVAKFVNGNPQKWSLPAIDLVRQALLETFPRR